MTGSGRTAPNVTMEDIGPQQKPQQKEFIMCLLAVKCVPVERQIAISTVDRDIRDFLAGKTDGEIVLHALYDHILDEPVPQRLRAVLGD